MTKNQKLIAAGVIIVFLLLWGFLRYQGYMKDEYTRIAKDNAGLTAQLNTYKDENGKLHGKIETFEVDKKAYLKVHRKEMDSIANLLDIKAKNINQLTTLVAYYKGKIKTGVDTTYIYDTTYLAGERVVDTVRVLNFPYQDAWMTFNGKLIGREFTADYTLTDSLSYVAYTKKTGFLGLGRKKSFVDVSGTNPNFNISNMKAVELTKLRDKPWSIGPYVGYGFNGRGFGLSAGVSLQRSIIRF
jgi:cell division protein FtsB